MELWCVAKNNAEDAALQSAIDWACGPGGANCGPIQPGGPCYDSKDIQKTASFVFNDYFLKHGMTEDACNFDNTAALISINPSKYFSPFNFHLLMVVILLLELCSISLSFSNLCCYYLFPGHNGCKFPSR